MVKPGYKQTEIGEIPEDWEVKELQQISPKQSVGLVINPSTYFDAMGTVPMLVGSNIYENFIDISSVNYITEESNNNLPASRLYTGDIVTVRVGFPGTTAVIPQELNGCNCASMMIIRKSDEFDSDWLCAIMNSHIGRNQIEGVQYGTAQKQFNISDAIHFIFPVPPLPEQQRIAEALSDVDALIASLEKLIAKKKAIKQGAMQRLLTGKTRLPGFGGVWEEVSIGNMGYLIKEAINPQMFPEQSFWEYSMPAFDENKTPVKQAGVNMHSNRIKIDGNILLFNKLNVHQQRIWFIEKCRENAVCSSEFLPYYSEKLNLKLLRHILFTDSVTSDFINMSTGTSNSQKRITPKNFLEYKVYLPQDIREQEAISDVFENMDAEIESLTQKLAKTRQVKQGMMQQLLTGKIRLV